MVCQLDVAARTVAGQVEIRVENPTARPLDRAYVWLYPNRLARPPEALSDLNHWWVYPARFNPGSMTVTGVRAGERPLAPDAWRPEPHADAGEQTLWSIALPEPVPPGKVLALTMDYRARVPRRNGSFGCTDGGCTLLGGYYPMVAALDAAGWDLGAPPLWTAMDVTVELAAAGHAVLFGRATDGPVRQVRGRSARAPYAPLVVAARLHESRRQVGDVTVRYLATESPPPADDARGQLLPYTREDYARFALDDAASALAMLDALGAPPLPGGELTLVAAPLRLELASAHPHLVVVSDRYYRIWPAKRFRKFHQRQLVRALFDHWFAAVIAARGAEADRDVHVASDLIAGYLTDLFVIQEHQRAEFADDILRPLSFVPAVDQLLYAPQTMFAGAYFGGVLDEDAFRDHPRRFMHQGPRGRLYYEKLRDLLAPDALREALRQMIVEGASFRAAAEAAYGASLDWFFRQWSRPYPHHDYRLLGSSSRPLEGGGYQHAVLVERRTAPGHHVTVEPVEVQVVLAGGDVERLRWDGSGEVGVLTLRAERPIARIVVDPSRRLVERALPGETDHPLFDNRDRHRLRFVYNSFGVLLNLTQAASPSDLLSLAVLDFSLSRAHDAKNRMRLTLFRSASVDVGGTTTYTRSFGSRVHSDRLVSAASVRLGMQRLDGSFFSGAGDAERSASRLVLGASVASDDRLYAFEPMNARGLSFGSSLSATRRDAAGGMPADYLWTATLAAGATRIFTPRAKHTFALDLSGAVVLGDLRSRAQLLGGGGPNALRGYAPGELFGRARVLLSAEYRHVFVHDLNWNLGHYNHVRGLGGALFFDVGALAPCESYDLVDRGSLYASAGYGLRTFYDSFGTIPQKMRIDAAIRLTQHDRACFGDLPRGFPPVMVYLSFQPPF